MKPEQAATLLSTTAVFGGLTADQLLQVARSMRSRTYRKGQYVFNQGDPGDHLFVLAEGRAKLVFTSEEGEELVLATLGPPEVFGELALIDESLRSAAVQALEPTSVLTLDRASLIQLMASEPAVTDAVLRSIGQLVRRLIDHAGDMAFLDLHARVAKLLVRFVPKHADTDGPVELDLAMSQSDIAAMVGGTRQSVNQVLKKFEQRGFLTLDGRTIVVQDLGALRRRASLS
jgi:CRP/FNR family cyclic AMP-dependent transcriptional regulator